MPRPAPARRDHEPVAERQAPREAARA